MMIAPGLQAETHVAFFSSSTAKGTQQMFGKSPRGFMDFAHSKADDVFVVKSFKIEVLFFWDCKWGLRCYFLSYQAKSHFTALRSITMGAVLIHSFKQNK